MSGKMNDKFYRSNSHARLLSEYVPQSNNINLMTSSFTQPRWSSISSPGYTPASLHTLRPAQSSFYAEHTTTMNGHHPTNYSVGYKSCPRRSSMSFLHTCPTDTDSEPSMGAYGGHIIYGGVHLSDSDEGQHSSDEESPQKSINAPLAQFDNVVCTCGASASNKARMQHELKRMSSGVKDFKQCPKAPNNSSPKDAATSPLNENTRCSFSNDANNTIVNDAALATDSVNVQGLPLAQPDSANSEDDSNSSSTVTMANLPVRHNSCASTLSSTSGPICRFCHLPAEPDKALISPCRCSGTLRYIHASCLATWLEISMRKNRQKVPRCELCNFEYIRVKKFKIRYCRFPSVSRRDRVLHLIFLCSFLLMLASAVTTILCFLSDSQYRRSRIQMSPYDYPAAKSGNALRNFNAEASNRHRTTDSGRLSDVAPSPSGDFGERNNFVDSPQDRPAHNFKPGQFPFPSRAQLNPPPLTLEEGVTLTCGILFFLAFFVGMTVQIKSRHTIYQLLVKLVRSNMVWEIQDYDPTKDPLATSRLKTMEDKSQAQTSSDSSQTVPAASNIYSAPSPPYQTGSGMSLPPAVTNTSPMRPSGPTLSLYSPPAVSSNHPGYSMLRRMSHFSGNPADPRFPCPADTRMGCPPNGRSANSNAMLPMRNNPPIRPYQDYYTTMPSSLYHQPRHSMFPSHQCDPLGVAPHHEGNFQRPHVHRQVWTHASLYPGGISLSRHV